MRQFKQQRTKPLQVLHKLKADMEKNGWIIDSFKFRYKQDNYIVLVILFVPDEPRPQYALLQLDFLDAKNFQRHLLVPANAQKLMTDAKIIREFFDIKYEENLGEILLQFSTWLGKFIPDRVNAQKSQTEKEAMVYTLSKKDSDDPSRIYCYAVKRNPSVKDKLTGIVRQQRRSPYNDNKTRVLRRTLYNRLGSDDTLSFCYSDDPAKSRTDEEIISNWASKNVERNMI
jgi:hypothetical protein